MVNNFQIGDEVKRINGEHGNFKQGDICKIIGFKSRYFGSNAILENDQKDYSHKLENLELVKKKEVNLLENLIIW